MSNTSYPKGMEKLLSGQIDVTSVTLAAALLPSTYTYSTSHEFLSQVGTRVGTDQDLTNVTITGGAIDADDLDFGALAPGDNIKAIAIYVKTGNASTSTLLLYIDTATGLPMATNGGAITIPWDDSVKKIARLNLPFYPKGAQKVWSGAVNFMADTLKVALLPSSYTYYAAHEFLADVGTVVGAAQTLAGIAVTNGVFDAADVDFGNVGPAVPDVGSAVIYKDTGSAASSPLLLHITDVVGLPLTPNGSGLMLAWSNGANRIINLLPAA